MVSQREAIDGSSDALDAWITEVGADYITHLADATREGVAAGTVPPFSDKGSFLEHLTRTARLHRVTWRVLTTSASEPDFEALGVDDRAAVVDELFAWVEDGPPRSATWRARTAETNATP